MSAAETIYTQCRACGVHFGQPNDPGRKRVFCSSACRQRDYRARGGRASGTRYESARSRQRRAEQEAWAEQEARREQERQRKARERAHDSARAGRRGERIPTPEWTHPRAGDSREKAKYRQKCHYLYARAHHGSTGPEEAAAAKEAAERLRVKYRL